MTGPAGSILLVEDDPALRLVCRVTLELEGFQVREADTLASAREAVGAERPGLVMLDLQLRDGTADGLLDELRSSGIAVVLVTGNAEPAAFVTRADGLLGKPFELAELIAVARVHCLG